MWLITFCRIRSQISTDALALLLLDSPGADLSQYAGLKPIIIPAKFRATDEHTLIYGHILQLGDNQQWSENLPVKTPTRR